MRECGRYLNIKGVTQMTAQACCSNAKCKHVINIKIVNAASTDEQVRWRVQIPKPVVLEIRRDKTLVNWTGKQGVESKLSRKQSMKFWKWSTSVSSTTRVYISDGPIASDTW